MEIEKALANQEFEIYLQPQIELKTRKITGAEALIRWNHPVKGYLLPGEFIPWCEQREEIEQIDRFVLEWVCRYIRSTYNQDKSLPTIGVNISRKSLCEREFINWCKERVMYYRIPIQSIELEMTESGYVRDIPRLIENVRLLKAEGFRISMDDFGEGYASLRMMQLLPIDSIKLDKNFLDTIPDVIKSRKLIKSIIHMANELGLQVTAEGIENCSQLQFLEQIGCHKVQGYLFSKPLSIAEYENYKKYYKNELF